MERITNFSYENSSKTNLDELLPDCQDQNPYIRANFGWVPQHVWIAPRYYYSYLAIYMTLLTIFCCFLNGIVVIATIKNKVIETKYFSLCKPFKFDCYQRYKYCICAKVWTDNLIICNKNSFFAAGSPDYR